MVLNKFKDRKLEWVLAAYTFGFGIFLAHPADSMAKSMEGVTDIIPEREWGVLYATVGFLHISALHINGRSWWTPFVRLAASSFSFMVFSAMAISIITINPASTGAFTYSFMSLGFCLTSIVSAGVDCGKEWKIWRSNRVRL